MNFLRNENLKLGLKILSIIALVFVVSCGNKGKSYSPQSYSRPEYSPPTINWNNMTNNTTPTSTCGSHQTIPGNHCWGAYQGYNYCGNYWYYQWGGVYWQFPAKTCGCNCNGGGTVYYYNTGSNSANTNYYTNSNSYNSYSGSGNTNYYTNTSSHTHYYGCGHSGWELDDDDHDYYSGGTTNYYTNSSNHVHYKGCGHDYYYDTSYYYDDDYTDNGPGCDSYSVGNYNSGWQAVKESYGGSTNATFSIKNGHSGYVKIVNVPYKQKYYISFQGVYGQPSANSIQTNEKVKISANGSNAQTVKDLSNSSAEETTKSCYFVKTYCLKKGTNKIQVTGLADSVNYSKIKITTQKPSGPQCK